MKPFKSCKVKKILFSIICVALAVSAFAQLNVEYQDHVEYNVNLNDVWGYVAPNGDEYALVGLNNGVSIVNVTDPENSTEVAFVDGISSTWRDIKTWGEHAYVTNESGDGVAVIDLSDLPNSVSDFNWTPTIQGFGTLESCHNIYIDEFGFAYLVGCNLNSGGMLYIDVATNPGDPAFVDAGPAVYSHDIWVNDNRAFCSEIYAGEFTIYNVEDKGNTILMGDQQTEAQFTHNTWGTPDNQLLFTTDEVGNAPVGSYDVSDPANIIELDQFYPFETLGDGVIPHNVHVWEDWIIISYYTDGCIIVDISNPTNLIEVGNFDTYIPNNTGFSGAWGAYPWLPSGTILVSDIGNGLYVLSPTYVNACWLEGHISDAVTSAPITGADIDLLATNVFETSGIDGDYATGYAIAGTYEVSVSKPGYETAIVEAVLENGVITILDVELQPLVSFQVTGIVLDEETMDPIPDAHVRISNADFEFDLQADANGEFQIAAFWSGYYEAAAGQWGWITECVSQSINEAQPNLEFILSKGIYDDFSFDFGWDTQADAETGAWERGIPDGTSFQGQNANPGSDVGDDCLNLAYVTGNAGGQAGEDDVDDGDVVLQSPAFSGMDTPVLYYSRWFANYDNTTANDQLEIIVSDGINEEVLEMVDANDPQAVWEDKTFNLWDYLDPADNYVIRVETGDDFDNGSIVEAGFDHFRVEYTIVTDIAQNARAKLEIYPNPSLGQLNLNIPSGMNNTNIQIWNNQGQLVRDYPMFCGNQSLEPEVAPGTYLVIWVDENGLQLYSDRWTVVR